MPKTLTTSIRIDGTLAHRLKDAAAKLHMRKNGIIVRAIEEYLDKHSDNLLKGEARKQSLLVSRLDSADESKAWEQSHEASGWQ
ncbi:MAG: hypothetical protein Q9M24_00945 [Mariprofundaceae bacterium]|nr:hypothetical protein [Mariprofundaceae bacterium]